MTVQVLGTVRIGSAGSEWTIMSAQTGLSSHPVPPPTLLPPVLISAMREYMHIYLLHNHHSWHFRVNVFLVRRSVYLESLKIEYGRIVYPFSIHLSPALRQPVT